MCWMSRSVFTGYFLIIVFSATLKAQLIDPECYPRLVDRRDLVEDHFEHSYITNNPRDIEVGYFSVEPITFFESGRRFCEASIPAAGVSDSYFRGTYRTRYSLPGEGVYELQITSNALIFNQDIRIINAQNTLATVHARHRMQLEGESIIQRTDVPRTTTRTAEAYVWEVEIDERAHWEGVVIPAGIEPHNDTIPGGYSIISQNVKVRGPGVVTIRESVIFRVEALSAYKYDPIFQTICLFNLEPLHISAKLLPCEE